MDAERLAVALTAVRDSLGAVRLPVELPSSGPALASARGFAGQLDDYILPRLARLDAPLLAVVGGSTLSLIHI